MENDLRFAFPAYVFRIVKILDITPLDKQENPNRKLHEIPVGRWELNQTCTHIFKTA